MTTLYFITLLASNLFVSVLTGAIVYFLLDKKIRHESDWLLSRVRTAEEAFFKFNERFHEHMYKYHK